MSEEGGFIIVLSIWCALGVIGGLLGAWNGHKARGFFYGFLLGPIGWALEFFEVNPSRLILFCAIVAVPVFMIVKYNELFRWPGLEETIERTDESIPDETNTAASADAPENGQRYVSRQMGPVSSSDVALVRGVVKSQWADGLVIVCTDLPDAVPQYRLPVTAGAGDSAMMAKHAQRIADAREEQVYGRLMALRDGRFQTAEQRPGRTASGTIFLIGHPAPPARGSGLQVVAVATGDTFEGMNVFTMHYEMKRGDWMWNRERANPLDRRPRR